MKKFSFTMENVLSVRKTLKEVRESELIIARRELSEEEQALSRIITRIAEALDPERVSQYNPAFYLLQREKYVKKLKTEQKRQSEKVEEARRAVAQAVERLRIASVEMKKMEKCRDREHAVWKKEFMREEQKINDDISNSLFNHKSQFAGVYR